LIELDGSYGEGGGALIRVALAFSVFTQQPFRIKDIRKNRPEPGLKSQHVHCIKALQKLSGCRAEGAELGSTELTFHPAPLKPSSITINIGTAGSTTLVLQAILLPCLFSHKPITLTIKGGTDAKWATPIDHFRYVLLQHLQKFAEIKVKLNKRGYYPKGNGEIEISIKPKLALGDEHIDVFLQKLRKHIEPYALTKQEETEKISGISHSSADLEKNHVAERIAQATHQLLAKHFENISIKKEYNDTDSTGCGITLWTATENTFLGADVLGEKALRAEDIGKKAAKKLLDEIQSGAVVDAHTADSLIPFLALAGGSMKTSTITPHIETNIYAVEAFLGKKFSIDRAANTITCSQ